MKPWKKRLLSCAAAVALLSGLSSALAATPGATTVHATSPRLDIYNDMRSPSFATEDNRTIYPLTYGGSVYLPVRTAGEWMGKTVAWDANALTVTLSGSVTPHVEVGTTGHRRPTPSEAKKYRDGEENGVNAQLCPDITVTLDGQVQHFTSAKGEPVYPLLYDGTVFLPLRSIGQLCGKEVFYVPNPYVPKMASIYIRTPVTAAEQAAVSSYLTQGIEMGKRVNPKSLQVLQFYNAGDTAPLLVEMKSVCAELKAYQSLPRPKSVCFDYGYEMIQVDLTAWVTGYEAYIGALEAGNTIEELAQTGLITGDRQTKTLSGTVEYSRLWVTQEFPFYISKFLMQGGVAPVV